MPSRTTYVHTLTNLSIDASSVLQIGDSETVDAIAYILAVQRERAIFFEKEFQFKDYSAFFEPLPLPEDQECLCMSTFHETPAIRVDKVNVSFAAASAVIHIGSGDCIEMETRVKNIRHLLRDKR
ncbi:spore germination protein GerPE [Brevibacillus brevis]|uniref:Spore germination protein GerPE n=1 Tax=Brevibacillus brevis TaxID=1393 RepID=A0ABY9SZU0_BREBE|nr:spore germination protein GerPE [Brevibacillus brevis]WNC12794.1 spore germination protein GerPE [Brevibacillus brevis]